MGKPRIAHYRNELARMDRVKQLTLAKLRGMNNELDVHITSLDGQQAATSAQMEMETKLDQEKAQLEVKMHENEEYMRDKQEKVKKLTEEMKAVQSQEATLMMEASKGHAKMKAAKAASAQDESRYLGAKHTYDSQKNQLNYLRSEMEDAVNLGDQARVQALKPS